MAAVRTHLRGRGAKELWAPRRPQAWKLLGWRCEQRRNCPREGHLSPQVTREPRTADFVNNLEVAFDLASRNCAKAREETQSGCEEEGIGAVGVLSNTSTVSARKCWFWVTSDPKKGKAWKWEVHCKYRGVDSLKEGRQVTAKQLYMESTQKTMAAYSLVIETEDKDLVLTRQKTWILKTYLMVSENPKICISLQCNCMGLASCKTTLQHEDWTCWSESNGPKHPATYHHRCSFPQPDCKDTLLAQRISHLWAAVV